MVFHDRYARSASESATRAFGEGSRLFRAARALAAVAALGALASGCASAARSTALVSELTTATLVTESSPLYNNVGIVEVSGGEETTLISKSKLSGPSFHKALDTSLDVMGALDTDLLTGPAPIGVRAQIETIEQPNLQISFTVTARIKYTVTATKTGKVLFQRTISSKSKVKFTESIVREERIRLATEGAGRENLRLFLREFVAHSRANPTRYRKAVAQDS